ncbi:MAG: hypothetical protein AAFO94_19120, partial [Bacteroidota bacterium]
FSCTDFPELRITAYDRDHGTQTAPLHYRSKKDFSIGTMRACEVLTDFVTYERAGKRFTNAPAVFQKEENSLVLEAGMALGEPVKICIGDYLGIKDYTEGISVLFEETPYIQLYSIGQLSITADDDTQIEGAIEMQLIDTRTQEVSNMSGTFTARKRL